jgi:hypothetical protein
MHWILMGLLLIGGTFANAKEPDPSTPEGQALREERLAKGIFQITRKDCVLFTNVGKPRERVAIRFTSFAGGKAAYQWLYYNPLTRDWVAGRGQVQEVYDRVKTGEGYEVVTVPGHNTNIQAGGITVSWSRSNENSGWLYFRPEHFSLEVFPAEQFGRIPDLHP